MIHCHHLDFLSVSEDVKSVQIFHTGRFYFVCQSCQFDGALLFGFQASLITGFVLPVVVMGLFVSWIA